MWGPSFQKDNVRLRCGAVGWMRVSSLDLMNKVEDIAMKTYLLSLFTENIFDATYQRHARTRPA
jgi:hypothetical protein